MEHVYFIQLKAISINFDYIYPLLRILKLVVFWGEYFNFDLSHSMSFQKKISGIKEKQAKIDDRHRPFQT